jgi:hypothetical protein
MSDLTDLLAAEAARREPARTPPFATLLTARTRRRHRHLAATGAAVLVVAAGGGSLFMTHDAPGPDVTRRPAGAVPVAGVPVSGALQQIGGPAGTGPRGIAGTVHFRSADGTVTSAGVTADGRFTATVPAGTYQVTGTPAGNDVPICAAERDVVVPAKGLDGIEVNCHIR